MNSQPPDPPWTVDRFLAVDRSPAVEEAERIEREVFGDAFDCGPDLWAAEFPPYDDRTVWLTVSHRGRMVGTVRAIVGSPEGLKFAVDLDRFWGVSLADALSRHGLPPDMQLIEAATLTVLPQDRRLDRWWPVRALSAAFWHLVADCGATHAVQLLDPKVLRVLSMVMGVRFERLAELDPVDFQGLMQPTISPVQEYLGAISTPDDECRRLVVERDEAGRGGTRLPPVDLTERSPVGLHRRLLGAQRPSQAPPGTG